jgi:hypothetical protein
MKISFVFVGRTANSMLRRSNELCSDFFALSYFAAMQYASFSANQSGRRGGHRR